MRFEVSLTVEGEIRAIVEAQDEDDALQRAEDALSSETYIGGEVGILSDDDSVEVEEMIIYDDTINGENAQEEE